MSLTALSRMNGRYWHRFLSWDLRPLYCWRQQITLCAGIYHRHIARWQYQNPLELIVTDTKAKDRMGKPFCWQMLVACFTQTFPPRHAVITLRQRAENQAALLPGSLAVIAVRQCG